MQLVTPGSALDYLIAHHDGTVIRQPVLALGMDEEGELVAVSLGSMGRMSTHRPNAVSRPGHELGVWPRESEPPAELVREATAYARGRLMVRGLKDETRQKLFSAYLPKDGVCSVRLWDDCTLGAQDLSNLKVAIQGIMGAEVDFKKICVESVERLAALD